MAVQQQTTRRAHPRDELAARLRLLQEMSGRGVRALARDTGLSSSSLSRYLSGQTVPPWPAVLELCRLVKRDPRPLRPLWESAANPLPAPPKTSRQVAPPRPPADAPPPPRNDLPRDIPDFTGREQALAEVLAAVRADRVVAIDGMAGVGKTSLAVHAAHQLTADYPDAQLYLDLHGFTDGRAPLDPDAALRALLAALQVPSEKVPQDGGVELRAACWRAELARLRAVIVLDNVADAAQVALLLPGAGESIAIVTSRNRLLELDEVAPVSLDVLTERESAELLARASGDSRGPDGRLGREPEQTAEVLRLCGNLPLALRLAAARLRHRPGWSIGILVERMAEGASEFDTAFGMSVRQLRRDQGRLFRLLGLIPGSTFTDYVAAAVADVPLRTTRAMLEDLLDAHLVQQPADGRYRLHDLVRQHARRATAEIDSDTDRERALGRVLDYYVHAAAAADAAMPFLTPTRPVSAGSPPADLPRFLDRDAAFFWYVAEYTNLMAVFYAAVEANADVHVCELPRFLRTFFARRCGTTHLNDLFERSLTAATHLGDPRQLAEAHSDLGFARYNAGRMTEAATAYAAAAPLIAAAGDPLPRAELLMRCAQLRWDEGDVVEPLTLFRQARELYAASGCPVSAADAVAGEAWAVLQLGDSDAAARLAREALALAGDAAPSLQALVTLGVAIAAEQPEAALTHLDQALAAARADGHQHNEAWCLNCRGVALRRMGRFDEAIAAHRAAFDLLDALFEEHWKIHFLNSYAETCRLAGLTDDALRLYRETLELAPKLGYRLEEARAHQGIADVLEATDPSGVDGHRVAAQVILAELEPPPRPLVE
ncbi:tetratricopeptide repeat protein [Nocardia mangyaensis]|uniref:tetratricopeptide repeat protein n=1 Tax=Nocardia mangyaensis TaxID=2213200 RepID=UPI000AB2FECD|nr:tetratricopeptide repeat protein [Nocardia mangyaensis]